MPRAAGAECHWRRRDLVLTGEPQYSWTVEAIFMLSPATSVLEKVCAKKGARGPHRGSPASVKGCSEMNVFNSSYETFLD